MLSTLLERPAHWYAGSGPEIEYVLYTQASLARNLADFPFPERCSEDEKTMVEERVLAVLESAELFSSGQYYSLSELNIQEIRLLMERHLISPWLMEAQGTRGVFLSDDQCVSIMVNERDHLRTRVLSPGLQLREVWNRVSEVDDALAASLDFAFDQKRGYLTSTLDEVGTGLRVSCVMHLPGLATAGRILPLEQSARKSHHSLTGAFGDIANAHGFLYVLGNHGTLGRSEEEIVYHLQTTTEDAISQERTARAAFTQPESLAALADRVGRALGIARGARVLEFQEALDLLSALRLGIATGQLDGFSIPQLNELVVAAQAAHIESRLGDDGDHFALSTARATLFREKFS